MDNYDHVAAAIAIAIAVVMLVAGCAIELRKPRA